MAANKLPAPTHDVIRRYDDTCNWLAEKITKIERDARFSYPPALVQVNAPLALIQVELNALHQAYTETLKRLEGGE